MEVYFIPILILIHYFYREEKGTKLRQFNNLIFKPIRNLATLPNKQVIVVTELGIDFISCAEGIINCNKSIPCEQLGVKILHCGSLLSSGELVLNCSRSVTILDEWSKEITICNNVTIWCDVDLATSNVTFDREPELMSLNMEGHAKTIVQTGDQRILLVYPHCISLSISDMGVECSPIHLTKILLNVGLTRDTARMVLPYLYNRGLFKSLTGLPPTSKAELEISTQETEGAMSLEHQNIKGQI